MTRHRVEVRLATAPVNPAAGDGLPTVPDWYDSAACATAGHPDLWFADKGQWDRTRIAKTICQGCEVRQSCAEAAIANDERWGVWGALTENERRALRRRKRGAA